MLLEFKIVTVFYWNIFKNVTDSSDAKPIFLQPLLQSLVSIDPTDIILICWFSDQESFLIVNAKNNCATNIFEEAMIFFILRWLESSKEQYLLF